MKLLLSPAKTLDFDRPLPDICQNLEPQLLQLPPFLEKSKALVDELKKFSIDELGVLMSISEKLARLNHERFQAWKVPFEKKNSSLRPAIFAFNGGVYEGIDVQSYRWSELKILEKTVVVLSGLYGMLSPLTLIRPYRLEMGTKLKTSSAHDLYHFWGEQIARRLEEQTKEEVVVNLASHEYFKVVGKYLKKTVISPVFKDLVKGEYKIVSFWAKKARGMMTSFVVKHKIKQVDELKFFNEAGYHYHPSPPDAPFFLREH